MFEVDGVEGCVCVFCVEMDMCWGDASILELLPLLSLSHISLSFTLASAGPLYAFDRKFRLRQSQRR